ncbi:hypothetical protein QYE76_064839 [Lolium multiflorum]|uniref:Uncharacterized protein n=1 Tax=Lolium multiflorum TaxID=4521 RepID=A0AAD8S861_LOLMU|nr:hypothetical protein QYE76_064839 [Lolium multiflorum]
MGAGVGLRPDGRHAAMHARRRKPRVRRPAHAHTGRRQVSAVSRRFLARSLTHAAGSLSRMTMPLLTATAGRQRFEGDAEGGDARGSPGRLLSAGYAEDRRGHTRLAGYTERRTPRD